MADTSEFRDSTYHRPRDTPPHLNYDDMARMAAGFMKTATVLARAETILPPAPDSD